MILMIDGGLQLTINKCRGQGVLAVRTDGCYSQSTTKHAQAQNHLQHHPTCWVNRGGLPGLTYGRSWWLRSCHVFTIGVGVGWGGGANNVWMFVAPLPNFVFHAVGCARRQKTFSMGATWFPWFSASVACCNDFLVFPAIVSHWGNLTGRHQSTKRDTGSSHGSKYEPLGWCSAKIEVSRVHGEHACGCSCTHRANASGAVNIQ